MEGVGVAWNGVRVVLGWLGIVSEGVRGCWSGVRAAWKVLECVGMVLEWLGMVLGEFIVPLFECFNGP